MIDFNALRPRYAVICNPDGSVLVTSPDGPDEFHAAGSPNARQLRALMGGDGVLGIAIKHPAGRDE